MPFDWRDIFGDLPVGGTGKDLRAVIKHPGFKVFIMRVKEMARHEITGLIAASGKQPIEMLHFKLGRIQGIRAILDLVDGLEREFKETDRPA